MNYPLSYQFLTCILFINLFLSGCKGEANLPFQIEERPLEAIELGEDEEQKAQQGRGKRARIEIGEEEEQRLIEQAQEISSFDIFPSEIRQEIFSYLKLEDILLVRAVNKDWNELITGFRQVGVVGVENKPSHSIATRGWVKEKQINFRNDKLKQLAPTTIPSFAFYCLMGEIRSLPQKFWPYLQGTQVHTVDLKYNRLAPRGPEVFAKHLQGTRVHRVDLSVNFIGYKRAGALAKNLQGTQVHTVDLSNNHIGDRGVVEFAKHLQGTCIHTVDLRNNGIKPKVQRLIVEQYPRIKWQF